MSAAQVTNEALTLSPAERVNLAQTLLESVGVDDAIRRDAELSAGTALGRSHDEVLSAAQLAIHSFKSPATVTWRDGLGAFVGEEEELARIQAVIDEEFGQIDPEDWR